MRLLYAACVLALASASQSDDSFAALDTNGDGVIDKGEWELGNKPRARETDAMALRTLAPSMPSRVHGLIHEEYAKLDPDFPKILEWMKNQKVFHEFSHGSDTTIKHFQGAWGILQSWNQPIATARCGLLHSAYSRPGFYFRVLDIQSSAQRALLRDLVGTEAEEQIWKYSYPQQFWDEMESFDFHPRLVPPGYKPATEPWVVKLGEPLNPAGYAVPSRIDVGETIHMSAKDVANYFAVWVADVADQWTDVSAYRDIYMDDNPAKMWPGTGRPHLPFNVFSKMLYSARPYLDVVPRVFNNCTEKISFVDEKQATNYYWRAVQGVGKYGEPELEAMYRKASDLNPYIAEPQLMLSQCLFKRGAFAEAAHHAISAIDLFQQWGTPWDKRHSFAQWLGFARMMLMRCKRRMKSIPLLPSQPEAGFFYYGGPEPAVTYIQDVIAEFDAYTEKEMPQQNKLKEQHFSGDPCYNASCSAQF